MRYQKKLCVECVSSESWLLNISGWHVSFYPFKKCNHRVSGWKPFFGTSFCPRRRVWINNTKSHCHTLHQIFLLSMYWYSKTYQFHQQIKETAISLENLPLMLSLHPHRWHHPQQISPLPWKITTILDQTEILDNIRIMTLSYST